MILAKEKVAVIKAKVAMEFYGWKETGEKQPLEMSAEEGGFHSGMVLKGTAELEKDEVYEILRAAKQEAKKPLFILEIE